MDRLRAGLATLQASVECCPGSEADHGAPLPPSVHFMDKGLPETQEPLQSHVLYISMVHGILASRVLLSCTLGICVPKGVTLRKG